MVREWYYSRGGERDPVIVYSYYIDGQSHESKTLTKGGALNSHVKRFPGGTKITVFYDPQNPNEACIEPTKPDEMKLSRKDLSSKLRRLQLSRQARACV